MSDFFQEPAAMVEMDDSADHNLAVEARAKLNRAGTLGAESLGLHRSAGEDFITIRDRRGRGNWLSWIAKHAKISERQVKRIIQLAESPDNLPVEEQMAILWGHPVRAAGGGAPRQKSPAAVTAFSRSKLWGGYNRLETNIKAFASENGLGGESLYSAIVDALSVIKTNFKELEKRTKP